MEEPRKGISDVLERSETAVISACHSAGALRVEWTLGFVWPFELWAWLGTRTDAERDLLGDNPFRDEVFKILVTAGLRVADVGRFGTAKQSQETVDRKYRGSWF